MGSTYLVAAAVFLLAWWVTESLSAALVLGAVVVVGSQLRALQQRIEALENRLAQSSPPTPEPATAPSPPNEAPAAAQPPAPSPPPRTPQPALARHPWVDSLAAMLRRNLLAVSGIALVVLGLSFLFPLLAAMGVFPPWMRLALAAGLGVALAVSGGYLRARQPAYAQVLEGGGLAILYLTLYVATAYYGLLDPYAGLAGCAALSVITVWRSVALGAQMMAFLGFAGAYLAPVLTVGGTDTLLLVLVYVLLTSLGAVVCACVRRWWALIVLGFCASALVAGGAYLGQPEPIAPWLQHLLVALFAALFVVAVPVYERHREEGEITLGLMGVHLPTPAVVLALEHWIGGLDSLFIAAALFALTYFTLAWVTRQTHPRYARASRLLAVVCIAVAVLSWADSFAAAIVLVTSLSLAVSFALGADPWSRALAGGLMMLATSLEVFALYQGNDSLAAGGLLALALALTSWRLESRGNPMEANLRAAMGALVLWSVVHACVGRLGGGFAQALTASLGAFILLLGPVALLRSRFHWRAGRVCFALAGLCWLITALFTVSAPVWQEGLRVALVWAVLAGAFVSLRRQPGERAAVLRLTWAMVMAGCVWLLALQHAVGWPGAEFFWSLLVLSALLWAIYRGLLAVWAGDSAKPLVVAISVVLQGFMVLLLLEVFAKYPVSLAEAALLDPVGLAWFAGAAMVGVNLPVPLRTAGVPALLALAVTYLVLRVFGYVESFEGPPLALLWQSGAVQPALSMSGACLGVGLLWYAVRTRHRALWLGGAGLCAATAFKLVVFDMAAVGTLYRVISFIGVGLLFLLAGFLAPLPPATEEGARRPLP